MKKATGVKRNTVGIGILLIVLGLAGLFAKYAWTEAEWRFFWSRPGAVDGLFRAVPYIAIALVTTGVIVIAVGLMPGSVADRVRAAGGRGWSLARLRTGVSGRAKTQLLIFGITALSAGLALFLFSYVLRPAWVLKAALVLAVAGIILTAAGIFIRPSGTIEESEKLPLSAKARPVVVVTLSLILAINAILFAIFPREFPYVESEVALAVFFWIAFFLAVTTLGVGICSAVRPWSFVKLNVYLGLAAMMIGMLFVIAGPQMAQTGSGDYLAAGFAILIISVQFFFFGLAILLVSVRTNKWLKAR